jgi:acylphosphatase
VAAPDPTIRRRLVVRGVVQGVGYRFSAARAASQRGLAGSAVNQPDGSVEVVVEGPADEVVSMIEWCRRGPREAVVESVQVIVEEPDGLFGFSAW